MKKTQNEFPYNINRFPVKKSARKVLIEIILDEIDFQRDLAKDSGFKLNFPVGSPINKFSHKQQIELLNRLENAVQGKPFIGNQDSDLILEEILYTLLCNHVEYVFDMVQDDIEGHFTDQINQIKKVYQLLSGDKKTEREDVTNWFGEAIWWDHDWVIFKIDTKKYKELYFAPTNKSNKKYAETY
jgi:hypothetical protein